jgi:hypothetical protein
MKEIMQPVTVLDEEDKNGFNLHFVSDVSKSNSIIYSINAIRKINRKWINHKLISDTLQLKFLTSKSIFSRRELNQYFIFNSTHGLEVSWELDGQKYNRIFWIKNQPHHKADNRVVKLKISKMDRKNKSLVLKLKVKQPIQHFWLYSTQKGIRYSENDITLLPGKKEITIHFETVPKSRDFKWLGLNTSE